MPAPITNNERIFRDYQKRKNTYSYAYHDLNILWLELAAKWKMKVRQVKDAVNSCKPSRQVHPKLEPVNNRTTKLLVKLGFDKEDNVGFWRGTPYQEAQFTHHEYRRVFIKVFPDETWTHMVKGGIYSDFLPFVGKNEMKADLERAYPSLQFMFRGDKIARILSSDDDK